MDVRGARALRARIEQHQHAHWQTAHAVQTGEQAERDPDREHLVRVRDAVREYEPRPGVRFLKVLVEGRWETQHSA